RGRARARAAQRRRSAAGRRHHRRARGVSPRRAAPWNAGLPVTGVAMRALAAGVVLCSLPALAKPAPAAKAPPTIDALLAGLAKAPGLYAHFRAEKHITLLQAPLVSEGSLYFTPPARF